MGPLPVLVYLGVQAMGKNCVAIRTDEPGDDPLEDDEEDDEEEGPEPTV